MRSLIITFVSIVNLILASAQIARRDGLLSLRIKSLQTLENSKFAIIGFSQLLDSRNYNRSYGIWGYKLKTVPTVGLEMHGDKPGVFRIEDHAGMVYEVDGSTAKASG